MLIVSSETAISGPRNSDGMPSPIAPAATSNRPTARSVPFRTKRPRANSISCSAASSMAPAMQRLVDDGVCGLGDNPGAEAHRPRRGRAAASLHAVGIAGDQPDPVGLGPEPFGDDLREARLVALTRRHRPQYQFDLARRIDRQLGALARRTGVELDRHCDTDAAAAAAPACLRP